MWFDKYSTINYSILSKKSQEQLMPIETYNISSLISEHWFFIISNCISFCLGVVLTILCVSVKDVEVEEEND